jgi:hypothetical protein
MGKSVLRAFAFGLMACIVVLAYYQWKQRAPASIPIISPVALWVEPADAVIPGWPATLVRPPKGELAAGEKLTILESQRGRSIWAIRVATADGRTGWINARDFGVKLSN